ncbi:MAG: GyrI-like domain-containing protein [Burkholderiales bacterium]|nr:GyrI-like domain-containing protein [Bacteroidia bacterium]
MEPLIKFSEERMLIGKQLKMSLAENKTGELWKSFMPRSREIKSPLSTDLISMQVYDETLKVGDLSQEFDKWATIQVTDFKDVPEEMECFIVNAGLYAVFHYKGLPTDTRIFHYIFGTWLPNSNYLLDSRPHFEILGEKYKNGDPTSEEKIWIPIKMKT